MKLGAGGMPASLERVEQLTKKKISFIEADLRLVLEIFLVVMLTMTIKIDFVMWPNSIWILLSLLDIIIIMMIMFR